MTDLHVWKTSQNITDKEIGSAVGVSATQIYRIRRGIYKPSSATAERLEALTGIPAWDFMRPDARQST